MCCRKLDSGAIAPGVFMRAATLPSLAPLTQHYEIIWLRKSVRAAVAVSAMVYLRDAAKNISK